MESISVIRETIKACPEEQLDALLATYAEDPRAGVQSLVTSGRKRAEAYRRELARTEEMWHYERLYPDRRYIGGIDEVGRGPLAGPVVAACVILPKDCGLLYINDSKQLTEKKREELYDSILSEAVSVGIGVVSHEVIDEINILQATFRAMREAIDMMETKPDQILVDAVHIPGIAIPQRGIIKGDAKSISIAAASIVAKVTRDRMMVAMDEKYPGYGFAGNKGYGSAEHIQAIREKGPCEIHRRSFIHAFIEEQ
ncbi:MAG: ribonuclease HII [Lachnospiraceae bacterium]|nr:ribonuclease HII [Lachnospiraceae bacterium]